MTHPERPPTPAPAAPATAKASATAVATPRSRWSPIWLVPLAAAGLVAYLAYSALAKRGPMITVTFNSADGLTAQQTKVKHKAVDLGTVEDIRLSDDVSHVIVRIRMESGAKSLLTDHARFWVVRPRLSAGNLAGLESGLETIVSGAYIAIDPGTPGGRATETFTGLEQPPGVRSDEPGRVFVLEADQLGSLTVGAPIFFRSFGVGEVLSYDLGPTATGPVTLRVFVKAPYDQLIHPTTRFWNASGITVHTGADGLRVELESLQALLSGGIAFANPPGDHAPASPAEARFHVYDNEARAQAAMYPSDIHCVSYFQSSVQTVAAGTPVQIFGIAAGAVTDVKVAPDLGKGEWTGRIAFDLQPERILGSDVNGTPSADVMRSLLERGVDRGLRVVLASNNFVTGQKVLSLEYVPGGKAAPLGREGDVLVVPSQAGGLDNIMAALSDVAAKLDDIPLDAIGSHADAALASLTVTLQDARRLVQDADHGLGPALQRLPAIAEQLQQAVARANGALGEGGYGQNSDFQRDMQRVLDQVNDAARSIRVLADFLDRHPEALLRGRTTQAVR